eukprot:1440403-Pleurochrysis_carterae.AAC.1
MRNMRTLKRRPLPRLAQLASGPFRLRQPPTLPAPRETRAFRFGGLGMRSGIQVSASRCGSPT